MQREALLEVANNTFNTCLSTMDRKNSDYAKDVDDALRNFKAVEFFHLTDISTGIAVRLCDKFMRICNLLHGEQAIVLDEKVEDAIDDMINYLVILKASMIERKKPSVSMGSDVVSLGTPKISRHYSIK